ncbi:polymeric immunoglobulin receptor-like [Colossoma macropomum]|uniref:polymeric immunoglobulin receptor-like n=1 Tax=Colossoma macropomum TaxID=42526 RepID=UPI00186429D4|nr:polymeric immunoglobulin receptor-like [Colossoma macropomum]
MQVWCYLLLVLRVAEGCTLEDHRETEQITAYTGGSVLLPCHCTDLHTTPERFIWEKYNTTNHTWEEISSESDRSTNSRIQLVNGHSPGNLSLLISHLTTKDGGMYRCNLEMKEHRFVFLTITGGCVLEKRSTLHSVTAHTGQSVLLPCYCTDLHTKPETFGWKKYNMDRNTWEEISSESGQYGSRVQLVNGHSPGNLSLLISHLTEEDGGHYQCNVKDGGHTFISLSLKGCILENSRTTLTISAHTGGSVLLPCYCTDLHTTPETFSWKKHNTTRNTWEEISSESGQYRNRVQLVNGHSPGNLSLLISHLTEEDGGEYQCNVKDSGHTYFRLTVTVSPQSLPFVPFAVVTVIFLHIIVAVVYCTKRNKDPTMVRYSNAEEDGAVSLQ